MRLKLPELNSTPRQVPLPACGLVVFEARHAPGFFGELKQPYAKFHFAIAGCAVWDSGAETYTVSVDTLCHISPHVPHRQRDLPGRPVALYTIHYRPDLLAAEVSRALFESAVGLLNLREPHQRERAHRVRALFQEMLYEQEVRRIGWEALLVSRLTDLAVHFLRWWGPGPVTVDRGSAGVARVAAYVGRLKTEFYAASSLDDAARSAGLGRRRFTELFREHTGESWRRHVLRLRLDYAARLLATTERSVTAIAFECGFEELSHFHHCFKTAHGCTPLAFRARAP